MIANRSVPVDTVLPHVVYPDLEEAIAWLTRTLGFVEHYRYGDPASGAQLHLGNAWIMVRRARPGIGSPSQAGYATQSLTIFVEDVDGHFARTKAAGAKIVEDLNETGYGERQYGVEDFAGHHWLFSRHARDVNPSEWGASVSEPYTPAQPPKLPTPRLCYMEVPAIDVAQSANFYEKLFGWDIRHRESNRPSFDDASGVSGAWVTGRPISRDPSLLPYVWVDDIDAMVSTVASLGGEVVDAPHPDHPGGTSWIATFRDPAGNVFGLYQEGKG